MEWSNGGDLLAYFNNNYKTLTVLEYTVIFFQILYTLAIIQIKFPYFKHNDLKANNILIHTYERLENKYYVYEIDGVKYNIPDVGINIYI